ncbi:hypothetical protein CYMTET_47798 [Cymbomonas tetramitiformis]|uniref:Major facilitator superfamily (MFS) profile domain-containing protein n=1 Tax=Cymbomonas tetramitiformis TaxID=36881 RepID=A0AAE0BV20_9CHLO|nr:hypothetical protein CYMTET_47798 [Cymbomonas tetramitiformis]|eukprot:gene24866-30306_t
MAVPPGIEALIQSRGRNYTLQTYRALVLVITFIVYANYHATRKPPSVVKSVLNPSNSEGVGWAPFNGPDGNSLLGSSDLAFLLAYSIGMFFSGHLGDTLDLRFFLTVGLVGSGFFTFLFGMGYFWDIHNIYYFYTIQILAGIFQSTGWPSVVSVVGNWFGKSKRGLIMGIWNAHTSVGNIAGTVVSGKVLHWGWGWCFTLPGMAMAAVGALVWLFLTVHPEDVGISSPNEPHVETDDGTVAKSKGTRGVGFAAALRIPGVISFSLCLFFSKLVAYTFLYWLPFYIKNTEIGGEALSASEAADLSIVFDIGGVAGGVLAGYLSDRYNAKSAVAAGFLFTAVPCLYAYREYGYVSFTGNVILLLCSGILVNGPYALITTAVSADLGQHESLRGNAKALSTVTAIIDGTGSFGAAVGPMLTGILSQYGDGWANVFYMLYASALCAGLLIMRLVLKEIVQITYGEYEALKHEKEETSA